MALAQRDLLLAAAYVMLIVVVPVIVLTFWFVVRYRASNEKASYAPDWDRSTVIEVVVWLVPTLIIVAVGHLVWTHTHELDPYKPLDSPSETLEVEVVAHDWKWLFIYPEQGIAVVNELVFPSAAPLRLRITSDAAMNSFYIPALGGQIYAMAGMQTRLNLLADAPGRFAGRNAQYSGDGFSDQSFEAIATPRADFEAWVEGVRRAPGGLDLEAYLQLSEPSIQHPVTYYSTVEPDLFETILAKYARNTMRTPQGHVE